MARTRGKTVTERDSTEPTAVIEQDTSFDPEQLEKRQQAEEIVRGFAETTCHPDERPAASHSDRHPPKDRIVQSGYSFHRSDAVAGTKLGEGFRLEYGRKVREALIVFSAKPPADVTKAMYESGFRWRAQDKLWALPLGHDSGAADRLHAERTYQKVTDLIREVKGVGQGVG